MNEIRDEADEFGVKAKLTEYLADRQDAMCFLMLTTKLAHQLDDIVDLEERRNDPEFIFSFTNLAHDCFSSLFYQRHLTELYATVKHILNAYADSVKWENSNDEAELRISDVIRCSVTDLTAQVVRITVSEQTGNLELGYCAMRDISSRLRKQAWSNHHNEKGERI